MKNKEQINKEYPPRMMEHVCESDGIMYMSNPPQIKCRICGRFKTLQPATPITWTS